MLANRLARASFAAVAFATAAPSLHAQAAIFLVRHAEKVDESEDPHLSDAGKARAEALARTLKAVGVKAVYVTQYKRTAETAAPLMAALGLKPTQVHSDASQELVDRMKKEHPKDVVLMVGHQGSVPRALKLLGVADTVELSHDEYDNLFLVVPREGGPPTFLRLKY